MPLLLTTMVTPMFMCTCGHLDREALLVTVGTLGIACHGWVTTRATFPWRLIHIAVVVLAAWHLAKNVGDVLFIGHNPLLK